MTLAPLLNASPVIQIHALTAILALLIGIGQLAMRKGTPRHRMMGYIWSAVMIVVAISSLFIHQIRMIGPFSPIHLFSINVLLTIPYAVWAVYNGKMKNHGRNMKLAFWSALVIAGLFTLLPDRIMGQMIFGP